MRPTLASLLVAAIAAASLLSLSQQTSAAPAPEDEDCQFCHAVDSLTMTFENGERLGLQVEAQIVGASAHGQAGLGCADCHQNYQGYPHPAPEYASRRDFQIEHYAICQECHAEQYEAQLDGIHQRALAAGRQEAAICTDCHGAHDITSPGNPPNRIPRTCGQCHTGIFEAYEDSVHGAALLDQANPDVPTCVDCHGVHNIADPLTEQFRLRSPEICAGCHADPQRMKSYGLSTDVVRTYVADFHGMSVTLAGRSPVGNNVEQAVCFDCHGVHDIKPVSDPSSLTIRENLLATCQRCHPNASEHFTEAWASHYIPSLEHHPLVYTVENFYATLLPAAGVIVLLAAGFDVARWFGGRKR